MDGESTFDKWLHDLEVKWEKYSIIICLILGLIFSVAHFLGLFVNVRFVTANVVNFASIVIGVTGVFLTLIITLKESPVFARLKRYFPELHNKLYIYLRNQIYFSLIVVVLSVLINALPSPPHKIFASFGVLVWSYFFWKMTIGAFFTVKIITDLIVRNFDIPPRHPRK